MSRVHYKRTSSLKKGALFILLMVHIPHSGLVLIKEMSCKAAKTTTKTIPPRQKMNKKNNTVNAIYYRICRRKGCSIFGRENIKKSGCGLYG